MPRFFLTKKSRNDGSFFRQPERFYYREQNMKNFLQLIVLTTIINISLTACSQEQRQEIRQKIQEKQVENAIKKLPKHNEPMPEYPQIKSPSELSNEDIDKNVQYVTTQVVEKSNKIIFFSKEEQADGERNLVENKENSEYYRSILGYTADGNCAIQDFYSENDHKQIEPVIVKKGECDSWKSAPFDGMAVWYDKNGKVNNQSGGIVWFKQGEPKTVWQEDNKGLVYVEMDSRPNVRKTVFVNKEKPANGERQHAVECELNEKENKIERFILFTKNNMVEKFSFNDNKIDPSRLVSWTENGYGFIDTVNKEKVEELQKLALEFCGVEK
ncbi:MAG: hypothetical protein J6T41_01255 [Neisseriaceae bacterium]|nr:hypothetical protein [Neisseriaceae bacterium]